MDKRKFVAWAHQAALDGAYCLNEEQAKLNLVIPFFERLGYDFKDPRTVVLEHQTDFSKKRPERADIVIRVKGKPAFIVECKSPGRRLSNNIEQLRDYYRVFPDACLGVLTDGLNFEFFSDASIDDEMSSEPFLKLTIAKIASRGLTDKETEFLEKIQKDTFDEDWLSGFSSAELLRHRLTRWLDQEFKSPSAEFCRYALSQLNIKRVSGKKISEYSSIVREAFTHGLAIEIYEKIQQQRMSPKAPKRPPLQENGRIVTTPREKEIFRFCQQRLEHLTRGIEKSECLKIKYKDMVHKFCIYYQRVNKGRLLDYYEDDGTDKFVFVHGDDEVIIHGASNIDKPLINAFRQRLEESKQW